MKEVKQRTSAAFATEGHSSLASTSENPHSLHADPSCWTCLEPEAPRPLKMELPRATSPLLGVKNTSSPTSLPVMPPLYLRTDTHYEACAYIWSWHPLVPPHMHPLPPYGPATHCSYTHAPAGPGACYSCLDIYIPTRPNTHASFDCTTVNPQHWHPHASPNIHLDEEPLFNSPS